MSRHLRPIRWLAPVLAGWISLAGGPALAQSAVDLPKASTDAFLHVLAHEMGHAFLREFNIPILGPEEDIADDFATIYIYLTLPDRAEAIISARARQHMADGDQPEMYSEYSSDDQRAGRSICLLYGQDPERFEQMARRFGLDGDAAGNCRDYATEVGRSWRRIIDDYRMPDGARVTEAGVDLEETPIARSLTDSGALDEAYALLSGIDWHSRITLTVKSCSGSSIWSRNGRRITICDAYVLRFAEQLAD